MKLSSGTLSKLALALLLGILPVAACDDSSEPSEQPQRTEITTTSTTSTTRRPAAETSVADDKPPSLDLNILEMQASTDVVDHTQRLTNKTVDWNRFNGAIFLAKHAIPVLVQTVVHQGEEIRQLKGEIKDLKVRPAAVHQSRRPYAVALGLFGLIAIFWLLERRRSRRVQRDLQLQINTLKRSSKPKAVPNQGLVIGFDKKFGTEFAAYLASLADPRIAEVGSADGVRTTLVLKRDQKTDAMIEELSKDLPTVLKRLADTGCKTLRIGLAKGLSHQKVMASIQTLLSDYGEINYEIFVGDQGEFDLTSCCEDGAPRVPKPYAVKDQKTS
jgi:hypothetical protein